MSGELTNPRQAAVIQDTLRHQMGREFQGIDSLVALYPRDKLLQKNHALQALLPKTVAQSIGISTGREDAVGAITLITSKIIQATVDDFEKLPFTLARQRTRTSTLRHIGEITKIVGLGDVDMAGVLERVDIRHMVALVGQHVPEAATQQDIPLSEIQDSLQAYAAPTDSFRPVINSLHLLPDSPAPLSPKEMKFLEVLIQVADATYAFVVLNNPTPAEGNAFDPNRLQVYPLSIQEFYQQKRRLGTQNATILTALNLLKDLRTNDGESLAPFLEQDESGEIKMTMKQLHKQQAFSDEIVALVGKAISGEYHTEVYGTDMGSWYRGTNNGVHPDVDLAFLQIPLKIPNHPAKISSWNQVRTYGASTKVEKGLVSIDSPTTLGEVKAIDPHMVRVIQATMRQFESIGVNVQFQRLSAWNGGIMFNISLDHPIYAHIDFDINLIPGKRDFGIEHTNRFNSYVESIAKTHGESGALQLLEDVRRLKVAVKEHSNNGEDKLRKVPGFLIESLFTSESQPKTYADVIRELLHYFPTDTVSRPEKIQSEKRQFVATFSNRRMPFGRKNRLPKIMSSPSFTTGGYEVLKAVVTNEAERLGIH